MKRKFQIFILSLLMLVPSLSVLPASTVGAIDIFQPICTGNNDTKTNAGGTDTCKERTKTGNPITNALKIVVLTLSVAIGVASVIIIIISGFKLITSQGNPQQVSQARSGVLYAVIGLVISVFAATMVGYVLTKL